MFVKAIGLPCFLASNCMIFLYNTRQYPRYTYRDYKPGGCDRGLAILLQVFNGLLPGFIQGKRLVSDCVEIDIFQVDAADG